ncbi:MAG: hypothetical protein IPK86_04395 [Neisseriales bacterium]|nr:MAG: hypothetical protein IPK86_04395 [Neisseriales bacterium]
MTTVPSFIFDKRKAYSILAVSTLTFIIGYMVWMMFAVIGVFIKSRLNLNATEFGLLMAVPVFTGSLMRAPLGFLVNRFGGRIVMFVVLLFSVIPIWVVGLLSCIGIFSIEECLRASLAVPMA